MVPDSSSSFCTLTRLLACLLSFCWVPRGSCCVPATVNVVGKEARGLRTPEGELLVSTAPVMAMDEGLPGLRREAFCLSPRVPTSVRHFPNTHFLFQKGIITTLCCLNFRRLYILQWCFNPLPPYSTHILNSNNHCIFKKNKLLIFI